MYSRSKKKNTPINFNLNDRRKIKLIPINMEYYLLWFDALHFFLGVNLHGETLTKFNLFNVNPQIWRQKCQVHRSNHIGINLHNIFDIRLRDIRRRNHKCEFLTRKWFLLNMNGVDEESIKLAHTTNM